MASVSTLSFLILRLYAKSRLFNVKFHFGRKNSFLKSRLYCIQVIWLEIVLKGQ